MGRRTFAQFRARQNPIVGGKCYDCGRVLGAMHRPDCYEQGVVAETDVAPVVQAPIDAPVSARRAPVDFRAVERLCDNIVAADAFAYCAALLCDVCAAETIRALRAQGGRDDGTTDAWPQYVQKPYDGDSPDHCNSGPACSRAIELPSGRKIGAWLGNDLTKDGIEYVCEKRDEQTEVGTLWGCLYADVLPSMTSEFEHDEGCSEEFFHSYLETALWSSTDDDGDPLDQEWDVSDIDEASLAEQREECDGFVNANFDDLAATGATDGQNGHDFWLSRCGHGAGFFDRGYGALGDRLQKAAKSWGNADVFVGDPDANGDRYLHIQ